MQNIMTVRGLPRGLQRDGWWLNAQPEDEVAPLRDRPQAAAQSRHRRGLVLGLIGLVALADLLFWGHRFGWSLALFCLAIFAVATWGLRPRGRVLALGGVLGLCLLPVVEYVQFISVMFALAGLSGVLIAAHYPDLSGRDLLGNGARLLARVPFYGSLAGVMGLRRLIADQNATWAERTGPSLWGVLRNWAFPVGGALIFAALLMDANPVLSQLLEVEFNGFALTERALFWGGMGLLIWPFLDLPAPRPRVVRSGLDLSAVLGINAGSTARALVVFNGLIAVQTGLDLTIFFGGATLPEGMSYATYAHRGAYPLLATATLAGGFAVLARPFLNAHRWLKPLMLVWLAQNVALCLSALFRLQLYIQTYQLTYLRVHAAIWIGLVAICLGLVAWQVWRARSTGWLVLRAAGIGAATLYLCAFVNFAGLIAAYNLSHDRRSDLYYLCQLGPTAHAEIYPYRAQFVTSSSDYIPEWCDLKGPQIRDWQEWGFRNWRVQRNLAAMTTTWPAPKAQTQVRKPQPAADAEPIQEPAP